ncbi:MAG: helix-turn-helix domain-containing protein [Acidobacteriota bacterium]
MAETAFDPDWLSPPGGTIEDLLEERSWTQTALAERLGFTTKHINGLIHGRVAITAPMAQRLSRVLGSTASFWLMREAQYRAALEQLKTDEYAESNLDWIRELPLGWMQKQGWIPSNSSKKLQVIDALEFFEVASVKAWRQVFERPLIAWKASEKFEKKPGAVAAWLRRCQIEVSRIACRPYDKPAFRRTLKELVPLSCEEDPKVFVPRLIESCAQCGVAVVFVPAPPGCPANGMTSWLSPDKAMLALSLRYKSNDHLWFTFFHEAGHILLHSKKLLTLEGVEGLDPELELEADAFARDALIPPSEGVRLASLGRKGKISKAEVRRFAARVGVAPGVVVGRLQKEGSVPWSHMNGLKIFYRWESRSD